MILLSDTRLNSDEFDINARAYVENLKMAAKAQAKEILKELDDDPHDLWGTVERLRKEIKE